LWFPGHGAQYSLVVRDFPKFSEVEGIFGIFVRGHHAVFLLATLGVDWGTQSRVNILSH